MKNNSLGIRNNNPANIRFNSLNKWKHQGKPNKGFCTFDSLEWGVRALLILLRKYRYTYGLDSVSKIISRFAPESENNTCAYISFVCSRLGVAPQDTLVLDFFNYGETSTLFYLCSAICYIESNFILDLSTFRLALSFVDSLTAEAYQRFNCS